MKINETDVGCTLDISTSTILVVGAVRNCVNHIQKSINEIKQALDSVADIKWLLIESDSDDQTLDVLDQLKQALEGFDYISLGSLREKFPKRTERLALCRNRYLEELNRDSSYKDVDYVVVADFDGVSSKITQQAIDSCWARGDWDVCAANQAGPYYDIWALRHPLWSPNDCWQQYAYLCKLGMSNNEAKFISIYSRMITLSPELGWIEVDSAFGGLAIYNRQVLRDVRYVGLDDLESEVCEHVSLHTSIIENGGNIYINPKLINSQQSDYQEHLPKSRLVVADVDSNSCSFWNKGKKIMKAFIKRVC